MKYVRRALESKVQEYLEAFPVVGITGPRQSGKSTLLQHLLPKYTYVTFDDFKFVEFFQNDPAGFFKRYQNHVIFDEVQKVPEIFDHIKLAVDQDRQNYGKFVITGSSQFAFLKHASESLAGRIGLLSLLPFQFSELNQKQRSEAVFRGSYPEIVTRNYAHSSAWYSSYIETYLNKDLRTLLNIGDLRDFRRFIDLLAARTSQILNMSALARDLGVAVSTVKRWVSALEASYVIFLLPPFYRNYGKRITKSPKVYFYDTGLVSYLVGIHSRDAYAKGPMAGSLFENYIVAEVAKKELHSKSDASLYYYRTSHGVEIDLIVDRKGKKELIEIKITSTFRARMLDAVKTYLEKQDRGYLLYNGEHLSISESIQVMNFADYLI